MGLKEIIARVQEMREKRNQQRVVLRDDQTKDNYLRSLRRERRIQMEEVEKKQLKAKIAEFKKQKMREELFGFNGNPSGVPVGMKKRGFRRKQEGSGSILSSHGFFGGGGL